MSLTTEPPTATLPQVSHPLDPLSAEEIVAAVALIRADARARARLRFASIALQEPPKAAVLAFAPGDPIERTALAVLLDNADGATYEALVSLTQGIVLSWQHIPGVQPGV